MVLPSAIMQKRKKGGEGVINWMLFLSNDLSEHSFWCEAMIQIEKGRVALMYTIDDYIVESSVGIFLILLMNMV